MSISPSLRGSQSDHVDALMFSGGIPNVVAAGKAVLKDWNRSVLTHLIPTINILVTVNLLDQLLKDHRK